MDWTRMWTAIVPGCVVEVGHYVEYLQHDWTFYGKVPVRVSGDLKGNLAKLPSRAVGFRLYTCAKTTIPGPDDTTIELASEPIEVGVTFLVGLSVSRENVDAIRTGPISTGLDLTRLLNSFDATPGAKILEYDLNEKTFFRVVPPDGGMTVIIDRAGVPVVDVAGPPEGWVPVTEFDGTQFTVDVNGNVLEVSGRQLDPPVLDATVTLYIDPTPSGLKQRVENAEKGSGVFVNYGQGRISFSCHDDDPPAAIAIQIDDKRSILLSWNGKKLTAVLTVS